MNAFVGLSLGGTALGLVALTMAWRRRVAAEFEARDLARRPRDADGVVVGARDIHLAGTNGKAVLVLHGFNDTPQSMAYLSAQLHAAGYTVHALRLAGHGCALPEFARDASAAGWRVQVLGAFDALAERGQPVYVCGQSMGAALAVLLAAERPVRALALLAPFIGLDPRQGWQFRLAALSPAPYFVSRGGEKSFLDQEARRAALGPGVVTARALLALRSVALAAQAALGRVKAPVLYVQSRLDNRVSVAFGERHFSCITATDKKQLWLDGSGHIISADFEKEAVAGAVREWFDGH